MKSYPVFFLGLFHTPLIQDPIPGFLSRQVGLSAMVSALGSLKAPWVQTSEMGFLDRCSVRFPEFRLERYVYDICYMVYIVFIGRDTQKWFSFNNLLVPRSCFLSEDFCVFFLTSLVSFSRFISVSRKYQPLRSSHHGFAAILQNLKGWVFLLLSSVT